MSTSDQHDQSLAPSPRAHLSTRELLADIVASTGEILVLVFYIVAFPAAVSAAFFIALTLGPGHIGIHLTLLSKGLMTAAAYLSLMLLMMLVEARLATGERVSRAIERIFLGRERRL